MVRIFKLILVAPIALVWDVIFKSVRFLYMSMCYIDREGEKIIERFLDER